MKYLLTCPCGAQIEVEPSQAGDSVRCECGAQVDVPSLRQIRDLPTAQQHDQLHGSPGWGLRQGLLTGGLMLAAVLVAMATYMWMSEPPPPGEFDPLARTAMISAGLDRITPAQAYQQWVTAYKPMRGFGELRDPREMALRDLLAKRRMIRIGLLSAAGVVALGAVAAFLLLPKQS